MPSLPTSLRKSMWFVAFESFCFTDTVTKEAQTALGGNRRIEKPNRTGSHISCVLERLATGLTLPQIQIGEICVGHVHLSANFEHFRYFASRHAERQITHSTNVVRDIVADTSVAPRKCECHHSSLVADRRSDPHRFCTP